jgi:hypothetical protein
MHVGTIVEVKDFPRPETGLPTSFSSVNSMSEQCLVLGAVGGKRMLFYAPDFKIENGLRIG